MALTPDDVLASFARAPHAEAALEHVLHAIRAAQGAWCFAWLRGDGEGPPLVFGEDDQAAPWGPWVEVAGATLVTPPGGHVLVAVAPLVACGEALGALVAGRPGGADAALLASLERLAPSVAPIALVIAGRRRAVQTRVEFLGTVAHELRTPLTSLQLVLQATAHHLDRPDGEIALARLRALAARGLRQGRRMVQLLDLFLDAVRVDRARELTLELAPMDLAALVRDVTSSYQDDLAHAGCELRLRPCGPVSGLWDAARLEQVVTNLLSNVMRHAPGRPVDVMVEGDASTARVVVRDHGQGIPADTLATLFERFRRGQDARVPGLGLGLFISRRIVEAHGGTLRAHSEPGAGATFVVELPREIAERGGTWNV